MQLLCVILQLDTRKSSGKKNKENPTSPHYVFLGANPVLRSTIQRSWPSCVPGRAWRTRTGISSFLCGCKKGRNLFHKCHCSFSIKKRIDLRVRIQVFGLICLNGNTEDNTPEDSRNLASFPILKIVTQMLFLCCIQNAQYTQERRCAPVKCTLTSDVLQLLFISC